MARSRASAPRASTPHNHSQSHAPAKTAPPPAPTHTVMMVQQQPRGSGILGTMAGVAAGSVLGHGISNYLYGNNTQAPTQPAEAQTLAKAASEEGHICAPQLGGYAKCLENNSESADKCKWAWDYFLQCQQINTP